MVRVFWALAPIAACIALAGALVGAAASADAATTAGCPYAVYPGDLAPKPQVAASMAQGATGRSIPGELPVMAALVESGLANLSPGDSDRAGYFQMRTSIWNSGEYAGFPENPALQLEWFIDQAIEVNRRRIAAAQEPYGSDEYRWGEWAADVERPAEQYRGRYQLRLGEARELIASACPGEQPLDTTAPLLSVSGKGILDPVGQRRIVVRVSCPNEDCSAAASGRIVVPAAASVYRFRSRTRRIVAGGSARLELRLKRTLVRRLGQVLEWRKVRARLTVTVEDAAGNAAIAKRTVLLRH
jgi:hypothetical protein